jgi:hypothetical protein
MGCRIAMPVLLSITTTTRTADPALMVRDTTSRCEVTVGDGACDGTTAGVVEVEVRRARTDA